MDRPPFTKLTMLDLFPSAFFDRGASRPKTAGCLLSLETKRPSLFGSVRRQSQSHRRSGAVTDDEIHHHYDSRPTRYVGAAPPALTSCCRAWCGLSRKLAGRT